MEEKMANVVILSAVRTGIGKFFGSLGSMKAPEIGAVAVKEALIRGSLKAEEVDEVILGNVLQAGVGQNPARQAALKAGFPVSIPAFTVNKVCGSGLKSVMLAAQAIKAGDSRIILAGGMESMTLAPYIMRNAREGFRLGHGKIEDCMVADGLEDAYDGQHMAMTAELVASEKNISRDEMDQFSVDSHLKAAKAWKDGAFDAETVAVPIPQKKADPIMFRADEGIRDNITFDGLKKLKAVFKSDGVITAGNASQISDGSAAVIVADGEEAEKRGIEPLCRIVAYATSGLEPKWVMMTPVPAVRMVIEKAGWDIKDVDLFEINEAFAVQGCAVMKELQIPKDKLNINGGGIALGHPIGASGARCLVTLIYAMQRNGAKRGVVSLCLGGGNGVAMAVEM
jgi:acetyl-CoA C-acetyltransferase